MELLCPTCKNNTDELVECEKCGSIGCSRCIRRKSSKWVCHKCPEPEYEEPRYYYPTQKKEKEVNKEEATNAFAAMFG